MSLVDLVDNSKTDKNTLHSYLPLYQQIFGGKKESAKNVLEIGIDRGGSIKLWRDYFPNAIIYGLDIMELENVWDEIKNNDKIVLYTSVNAYDDHFFKSHILEKNIKFDILLDDGPHSLESMVFFIETYSQVMADDGILIVEDVQNWEWIEDLKAAVPPPLKEYIKVYDLRSNNDRYDDIVFTIDKYNNAQAQAQAQTQTEGDNREQFTSIPFWTEDPNVLFDNSNIMKFYPSSNMTYIEKLNTVSRVVILLSLFLFMYTKNIWVLVVCVTTLFFIYLLYDKYKNGEGYLNPLQKYLVLTSSKEISPPNTETESYQEGTPSNPLSNVLLTDYDEHPYKKPAPPSGSNYNQILGNFKKLILQQHPDQPDIRDKLFFSMTDQLDFENSLRPFYSTANTTIPNDQTGFAEFCYRDMIANNVTCKEGNLLACDRNLTPYTLY